MDRVYLVFFGDLQLIEKSKPNAILNDSEDFLVGWEEVTI